MLLSGARVAILVEDLFEEIELTSPRDALTAAGAKVVLVGPMAGRSTPASTVAPSRQTLRPARLVLRTSMR